MATFKAPKEHGCGGERRRSGRSSGPRRGHLRLVLWATLAFIAALAGVSAPAQATNGEFREVARLTGTGEPEELFGVSAALSGDGKTAMVANSGKQTVVFVFVRSGSTWTLQAKLTVTGGARGLALSSNGNIALIGGYSEIEKRSAAWVFTRSGSIWKQGAELTPNDEDRGKYGRDSGFGASVALSSNGDTALIGGPTDHWSPPTGGGAAWVFTRSHSTWAQQGPKLVASPDGGEGEPGAIGSTVALSGDGGTALLGGAKCNGCGAGAFVFTRSQSTWTKGAELAVESQAGLDGMTLSLDGDSALVGGGPLGGPPMTSVLTRSGSTWTQRAVLPGGADGLSAHGNTALVGGSLFVLSHSVWSKVGEPLNGGYRTVLSANGKVALTTSPENEHSQAGEAWVYQR